MPYIGQGAGTGLQPKSSGSSGDYLAGVAPDLPPRLTPLHEAMSNVRNKTLAAAKGSWLNSRGRWNPGAIQDISHQVSTAQLATSTLQAAYLQDALNISHVTAPSDYITERPGVSKQVEYSRPFNEAEWQLGNGASEATALARGLLRLEQLVASDVQMAKTKTAQDMLQHSNTQKYRRVIGSANPCPLCLLASTQTYYTSDLMPIHPGCECDVEEMAEGFDPRSIFIPHEYLVGPTLSDGESTRAKGGGPTAASIRTYLQSIAQQYGSDTPDLIGPIPKLEDLIQVREHGELGPVLTYRGQSFRGPNDLPHKPSSRLPRQVGPPIKLGTQVVNLDDIASSVQAKMDHAAAVAQSITNGGK